MAVYGVYFLDMTTTNKLDGQLSTRRMIKLDNGSVLDRDIWPMHRRPDSARAVILREQDTSKLAQRTPNHQPRAQLSTGWTC